MRWNLKEAGCGEHTNPWANLWSDAVSYTHLDRANKDSMRTLNRNSRASLQKVGIVKYNAFKGMGGNLSSVVALLDYTNSGFILNCVHSREGCYIYVKVVDMGQTEIVLGNEEQEALEQAMGYIKRG